ncbi:hypothetical protein D3C75_1242450 [compost metagenome]
MYGADRQQAYARATGGQQIGFRILPLETHLDHFYAPVGQGFPDDAVGGELFIADDDPVTGLPINTESNERKGL